jgi:hypothetical protein
MPYPENHSWVMDGVWECRTGLPQVGLQEIAGQEIQRGKLQRSRHWVCSWWEVQREVPAPRQREAVPSCREETCGTGSRSHPGNSAHTDVGTGMLHREAGLVLASECRFQSNEGCEEVGFRKLTWVMSTLGGRKVAWRTRSEGFLQRPSLKCHLLMFN